MPQTLGPFTLSSSPAIVPGAAFAVPVNRAAQCIQVHNDTPDRLYFQFDGAQPTAITSMNGAYVGMAAPWSHPVIPVQRNAASARERALNAISDFQGVLWIMVVDPTAALAQSGAISTLTEIHIDVYLPGEAWPQSWAIPRQHDLTSQPRVITVPMAWTHFTQGRINSGATYPQIFAGMTFSLSAAQQASKCAAVYFSYCQIMPEAGATVGWAFQVGLQFRNSSHVNVSTPFVYASGAVLAVVNAMAIPWIFAPTNPFCFEFAGSIPATATEIVVELIDVSGTPPTLDYTVACSLDTVNSVFPTAPSEYGLTTIYPTANIF